MTDNEKLYAELTAAAENDATDAEIGEIILRAYNAGWETGDVYEALHEGGSDVSFGGVNALAQRAIRL
jgi:hypothetical protein